jgi:hypothetical protein
MGKKRRADRVLAEGPRERDDFEYLDIDGRIILKCIFNEWDGEVWNTAYEQVVGCCECGNEPSRSIKFWEGLDLLMTR